MFPTTVIRRRLPAAVTGSTCMRLPRTIHGGRIIRQRRDPPNPVLHGAENYFVDRDDTPPPNSPIYKVDATSDVAQSAYEPPSGPWSWAGAGMEYRTVSNDEPYDVPSGADAKSRYGGVGRYAENKGPETSKSWGGSEGTRRWGRKPEGRT